MKVSEGEERSNSSRECFPGMIDLKLYCSLALIMDLAFQTL